MPSTTVLENKFVTMWFHEETKIVHHKFHRPIGGKQFQDALLKGVEIFKVHGAKKWLSDDRENSALGTEDRDWAINVWFPQVAAAGWKYWAIILPKQLIGQINMQRFIDEYSTKGITTRVFSDADEARKWLEIQ
jgi:hypothetical protein